MADVVLAKPARFVPRGSAGDDNFREGQPIQ